jgi:uncharacterized protein YciI
MPVPHFVIYHSPGENWAEGIPFMQQPNVMDHANYFYDLYRDGKVLMGGPIPVLNGGMMVMSPGMAEDEVAAIAAADPTVLSGLIKYEVKMWIIAFGPGKEDG